MIVDDIRNSNQYAGLGPLFQLAFNFLSGADLDSYSEGKYSLQDDRVLAIVSSYQTIPIEDPIMLEGHLRYIDIQFVVSGREQLAWAPADSVTDRSLYDSNTDAWTAHFPKAKTSLLRLKANDFAILFPWEAHAPQLQDQAIGQVKKVVVKIAVNS